ncbi:FCD domain-containing protein [Mesorhizobium sp. CAU 1732]|uniref:GntR family transcriptional regulator n=1 Tax=Mesorhizobium sp. CAU 1732 TaxID=3140358 RepID=UPI00325FEBFB
MIEKAAKSRTEQTFLSIRADILSCRHLPGERLLINALCEQLGASLGAVREALSRLAAEGLIQATAQKGFRVTPVSAADLEDLTNTRCIIEDLCLRSAIQEGGVEWETGIVASFHRLSRLPDVLTLTKAKDIESWGSAHEIFHLALVSSCSSPWQLRLRAMLFDQADRYRRLATFTSRVERDVLEEHRTIMEATLDRNTDRACALMDEHLRRTSESVSEFLRAQPTESGPAGNRLAQLATEEIR